MEKTGCVKSLVKRGLVKVWVKRAEGKKMAGAARKGSM